MHPRSLLFPLLLGALGGVVVTPACTSTPEIDVAASVAAELAAAPAWVVTGCRSYWDEAAASRKICGVGSAVGAHDPTLTRRTAVDRGRTEVVRDLSRVVQALLREHAATARGAAELGGAVGDERYIVDLSKQITDASLAGTQLVDSWTSPNGTFYALVALESRTFSDTVGRMEQLPEEVRKTVGEGADEAFAVLAGHGPER